MSDSGFTGLPPGARLSGQSLPPSRAEIKAEIIAIRGEARVQKVRERMEGEVVKHNRDGTTRIRTDRGELTVKFRGRDIPPEGQRVELDIPAGKPPRQLTVRPPAPTAQTPQPAPAASTAAALPQRATANLTASLPALTPATQLAKPALEAGQTVRLLPLSAQQAQSQAALSLPTTTTATRLPAFTASLPQSAPSPGALSIPQTAPVPAFTGTVMSGTTPASNGPTAHMSGLMAPSTTVPSALSAPPTPALSLSSSLQAALPSGPSLSGVLPAKIDALVTTLNAPQATLLSPQSGAAPAPKSDNPFMPSTASAPRQQPGAAGTLSAQVTGSTPQHLPILSLSWPSTDAPLFFALQMRAGNVPPGTQIQMIPQGGTSAAGINAASRVPLPLFALPPGGGPWPLFDDLYQSLQQVAPQAAQNLAQILPQTGQGVRLPLMAFFFIAAARAGDLSGWLGDKAVDALKRAGKSDLLDRLSKEIKDLAKGAGREGPSSTTGGSSSGPEWRSMSLPLLWGEHVYKVLFHYHQDQSAQDEKDETATLTRFVFDLELPRMGDIQLDGFHRAQQLDLIIRAHSPFSTAMQHAMLAAYTNALEAAGLSGELSFQSDERQWVNPGAPGDIYSLSEA